MEFQPVTYESMGELKGIVNSNPEFNELSEGHAELTDDEIVELYESSVRQGAMPHFVMVRDCCVGVIDYLMENPADQMPWLGFLMIHRDYQGRGYAIEALSKYEDLMRAEGIRRVRLGVIKGNHRAVQFWMNRGFQFHRETQGEKWTILCFDKDLCSPWSSELERLRKCCLYAKPIDGETFIWVRLEKIL